ncbi:lysophospholipase L1-like esterase [Paenibacillus sp. V4I3]|uniref:SGNH/GDSL hydrolase family protein n=1 Tax=Paenibacillus sp. V4I3 TaxID=3042305 RepID=UPI002783A308|nr:SGNH/GDSL hydrolase family protein [Paenibacillus sp. V4I3]MDQ0873793.1 lysophospholipase L1-like esterase [Paenibacillus sp. V4I3]
MSTNKTWVNGALAATSGRRGSDEIKRISVGSRGQIPNQGMSNGAEQSATFLTRHVIGCDCHDITVVYPNWHSENGGDVSGDNDIMVKFSIKSVNASNAATYFPAYFGDVQTVTIKPGATVESEPVAIDLKKGDVIEILTYVSVTTLGQKWPQGMTIYAEKGDGKASGVDNTAGGSCPTVGVYGYTPLVIVGTPNNPGETAIMLVGDSVISGGGDGMNDMGYAVRAINDKYAYSMMSRGGTSADGMINQTGRNRMKLAKYFTSAIVNFFTNDINNAVDLAQREIEVLYVCNQLYRRGIKKIAYATCTPRTTSTDSWATVGNQTTANSYFAAGASKRGQANAWLRSLPAPITAVFDVSDMVENNRDSGIWKAGYTDDGIHPNVTGHIAAAKAIDLTVLI